MTRRELPGWGRLYTALGGGDDARWRAAGAVEVRGKLHGYCMQLDLSNWSERLTWFLGRYHDLPLQQALQRVLRPGDRFVDIGANIGMLTLLARALVGSRGSVWACEPNPQLAQRIAKMLTHNELHDVAVLPVALSDQTGSAMLRVFDAHPGWGSLADSGPAGAVETRAFSVALQRGDEALVGVPSGPLVLKVDVEGHELAVLRGLRQTLRDRRPILFVEVIDAHLRRAGSSAAQVRAEIEQHGYRSFELVDRRRGWFGHDVAFRPMVSDEGLTAEGLFVPTDGDLAKRVQALLG